DEEIRGQAVGAPREEQNAAVAGDDAAAELTTGTGEHAAEHVPRGGAECDTDPNLAGATRHGDGHECVQTGRREDYSHEQNAAEDDAAEHHPFLLLCGDVVEGDDIPEVQTRIDLPRKGGRA